MNILGPEFKRYCWMRFSQFSTFIVLILIAVCLGLIYVSYLVELESVSADRMHYNEQNLVYPDFHWSVGAYYLFAPILFFVAYLYGALEAATSFSTERSGKTWDWKKISAIRPIHLMLGKLFGSTSYVWYITLLLLPIVLYGYAHLHEDIYRWTKPVNVPTSIDQYPDWLDICKLAFVIIVPAFLTHLIATFGSLQNMVYGKKNSLIITIISAGLGVYLHRFLTSVLSIKLYSDFFGLKVLNKMNYEGATAEWFGHNFQAIPFILLTLLYLFICLSVALYRLCRRELNFQSFPFFALLFYASLSAYVTGFFVNSVPNENVSSLFKGFAQKNGIELYMVFMPTYIIFLGITVKSLWYMGDRIGDYQRFIMALKRKNLKRTLESVPMWMFTAPVALATILLWCFTAGEAFDVSLSVLFFSIMAFITRDALALHILSLGDRFKRGGLLFVVYIVFAYAILPYAQWSIMELVNGGSDTKSWAQVVFGNPSMYFPTNNNSVALGLVPIAIQVTIATYILWRVLKPYRASPELKTA